MFLCFLTFLIEALSELLRKNSLELSGSSELFTEHTVLRALSRPGASRIKDTESGLGTTVPFNDR